MMDYWAVNCPSCSTLVILGVVKEDRRNTEAVVVHCVGCKKEHEFAAGDVQRLHLDDVPSGWWSPYPGFE